jgi:hypothetical protein
MTSVLWPVGIFDCFPHLARGGFDVISVYYDPASKNPQFELFQNVSSMS